MTSFADFISSIVQPIINTIFGANGVATQLVNFVTSNWLVLMGVGLFVVVAIIGACRRLVKGA